MPLALTLSLTGISPRPTRVKGGRMDLEIYVMNCLFSSPLLFNSTLQKGKGGEIDVPPISPLFCAIPSSDVITQKIKGGAARSLSRKKGREKEVSGGGGEGKENCHNPFLPPFSLPVFPGESPLR